jgi:hypothetical protein
VYYPLKPSVQLLNFCSGSGESENPDSDGYEGYEDPNYWPDCNSKYSTLKQLEEAKDGLPENCVDQYIVDVQVEMNDGALKKYKSLIDNGYDKKFEVYEKYLRAQIPEQINHLMATDKVSKYFKCSETKYGTCCKDCRWAGCYEGCIKGSDCKGGQGTYDIDCPRMEFEDKGLNPSTRIPNATFTLKDSDGFYKDIYDNLGIEKDWIKFDRRLIKIQNGCQYSGEDVQECMKNQNSFFFNYPQPNDKVSIYNPKKIIGDNYPKAAELLNRFKTMQAAAPYECKRIQ